MHRAGYNFTGQADRHLEIAEILALLSRLRKCSTVNNYSSKGYIFIHIPLNTEVLELRCK